MCNVEFKSLTEIKTESRFSMKLQEDYRMIKKKSKKTKNCYYKRNFVHTSEFRQFTTSR